MQSLSIFHSVKTGKVQKSRNKMGKCFCGRWEIQKYIGLDKPECIWNSYVDFHNCLLDLFQKFGVCFV